VKGRAREIKKKGGGGREREREKNKVGSVERGERREERKKERKKGHLKEWKRKQRKKTNKWWCCARAWSTITARSFSSEAAETIGTRARKN
jgi:hypothetical protein